MDWIAGGLGFMLGIPVGVAIGGVLASGRMGDIQAVAMEWRERAEAAKKHVDEHAKICRRIQKIQWERGYVPGAEA